MDFKQVQKYLTFSQEEILSVIYAILRSTSGNCYKGKNDNHPLIAGMKIR